MRILISAYRCSPYDVSEAYSSFCWVNILSKKHHITLLTTEKNKEDIVSYYESTPENLFIIGIPEHYFMMNNRFIHKQLKIGYFIFNKKIEKYLKNNLSIVENADILFHRSPQSFRYFSTLYKFEGRFLIGPLEGGLKPPKPLRQYFRQESFLFKLRNLDQWLLKKNIYQKQFKKAEKILISLDYVREYLPREFHEKTYQIFNTGIHCHEWHQNTSYKLNKNESVNILFIGNLIRYKGCELVIRAISRKRLHGLNFNLTIVGKGEERNYLEKLAKELGVLDKIMFTGQVSKNRIKSLYGISDIFCFPTLKEAAGNVFLEAMASALPIVTVDYGGPKYICPSEGTFKVQISDIETMVESISKYLHTLITDKDLRVQMGKFNAKHCKEHFDWNVISESILKPFELENI